MFNLLYVMRAGCRCFHWCLTGHLIHAQAQLLLAGWTAVGCLIRLGFLHFAVKKDIKTCNGLIIANGSSCYSQDRKKIKKKLTIHQIQCEYYNKVLNKNQCEIRKKLLLLWEVKWQKIERM